MATVWFATPGKTLFFFGGSEDNSWYLLLWCQDLCSKFAWQARDGTALFLFCLCYSKTFEGLLEQEYFKCFFPNLPS